jgi:hypothetical protein
MMSSTLIAIMGREAAYTGQKIQWAADAPPTAAPEERKSRKEKAGKDTAASAKASSVMAILSSQQDLAPDNLQFGDAFDPGPIPRPGVTKFV